MRISRIFIIRICRRHRSRSGAPTNDTNATNVNATVRDTRSATAVDNVNAQRDREHVTKTSSQ
jgi:hypothetical protein